MQARVRASLTFVRGKYLRRSVLNPLAEAGSAGQNLTARRRVYRLID
jgi:hypothetical protein